MKIRFAYLLAILCTLLGTHAAFADTTLTLYQSFAGYVNFVGTQKTLRTGDNTNNTTAASLVTGTTTTGSNATTATLSGLPATGTNTIRAAYLYWAGSGSTPNYTVTFENSSVTATRQYTIAGATGQAGLDYFMGVADVTAAVMAKGNGSYTFSGMVAENGLPWSNVQGVLAGWALLVVYENPTTERFRVANVYEGFQQFYGSNIILSPSNFKVPASNIDGKMAHLTWEGDVTNSGSLGGFNEALTFNGTTLTDTNNPSNNQFNSVSTIRSAAVDSASYGIDFDAYDVSSYLTAGATSATSIYSSGGDLVLLAMEIISVTDTPVSDLGASITRNGTPVNGSNHTYTLNVSNNGPADDPGPVTVSITLGSGLSYVSAAGTNWSCVAGTPVVCTLSGTLANGASAGAITLTAKATVSSGTLTATAVAATSATNFDNYTSNNTASDSYTFLPTAYAYYAMNEASWNGTAGEVIDSGGSGRNATSVGGISTVATPAGGSKPDTCRGTSIPDNYSSATVQAINTGINVNSLGNAGTIAFWYQADRDWNNNGGNNDDRTLLDASPGGSGEFWAVLHQTGSIRFRLDNASGSRQTVDTNNYTFAAGTWVHVAVSWDFGAHSMCVYVNGVADSNCVSGQSNITSATTNYGTLYVGDGAGSYTNSYLRGYSAGGEIDELRIYSGALSTANIAALMTQSSTCSFDHVRIQHDGVGDMCSPAKSVTIKACANSSCSSLYPSTVAATLTATGGTWSTNPVSFAGSTTDILTASAAGTVTVGALRPNNANSNSDCYNTAANSNSCSIAFSPCVAACTTSLSGIVNTYYPGSGSPAAGATSVTVGASAGAATGLRPSDMVLVIQMQDATINTTNGTAYGANNGTGSGATSLGKSGLYEYKVVSTYNAGTGVVTFTSPLVNSYATAAATSSAGQKTFQVIRVPVLASYTMSTPPSALAWNGSVGGVLAFDVTGTLTFSGNPTIDVSGMGFSGGAGLSQSGAAGTNTDFRTSASNAVNGAKGEGIAGTPSTTDASGAYGYPSGSNARGAPGNAGGGATDRDPAGNDQNTGGAGGAGYGPGGFGGIGWCPTFSAASPPNYGCTSYLAIGGAGVTSQSASLMIMGGGGGAGTTNNATGTPGGGVASGGAAGGGLIFVRAAVLSGTATFNANGASANNTVVNDGSGGGGGGGAVLIQSNSGLGGITINAKGGVGGTNNPGSGVSPHGPGGGGGGGYAITSAAPASCTVSGGANGQTYNNNVLFGAYGATAGSAGSCVNGAVTTPGGTGTGLGSGPSCTLPLDHYAISYPNGNPGVTCEALAVRITGHDSTHVAVSPGTAQITLATSPATGGWKLKSGGGTFSAPNQYTFNGSETYAEFWLTQTTALANINIDVTDSNNKTDIRCTSGCSGTEDASATFANAVFRFYSDNTAGTLASIGTQSAGAESGNYYLRAIRTDTSTGTCTAALQNQSASIGMGYQCNDPTTCYTASAPVCGSGNGYLCLTPYNGATAQTAQPLGANVNGSSSNAQSVTMYFDTNGYAPFTFDYKDVGQITLLASKTLAADNTKTPPVAAATLTGSTNAFVVQPYSFTVKACTGSTTPCTTANASPSDGTGTVFTSAGKAFNATITAVTAGGVATPSFGLGTGNGTETVTVASSLIAPKNLCPGPADCPVTLSGTGVGTSALYRSSFSNGVASVTDLAWSEVGVMTLTATNATFLGNSLTTSGTSGNIGRFTPSHFGITGSVQTRSDVATGSAFTYMDEPMKLTLAVTAYNASEAKTQNYAGSFAKLNVTGGLGSTTSNWTCTSGTQCMGLGAVSGTTGLSARWSVDTSAAGYNVGLPSSAWSAGVGAFMVNVKFARNAAPDGSYPILKVGGAPLDSDGVTLPLHGSADKAHCVDLDVTNGADHADTTDPTLSATDCTVGTTDANLRRKLFTTDVRFGRLHLFNAYGSELLPLSVPVRAEYWNGSGWVLNTSDSLTSLTPSSVVSLGNCTGTLNCAAGGNMDPATHISAGTVALSGGLQTFTLIRPTCVAGACPTGSLDFALALGSSGANNNCVTSPASATSGAGLPWLQSAWCGSAYTQDPNARATFGTAKSRYIYLRERY